MGNEVTVMLCAALVVAVRGRFVFMSSPELPDRIAKKKKELEIDPLFKALVKLSGSDLHLKVDRPPYVRVKGALRTLNRGPIDDEEMNRLWESGEWNEDTLKELETAHDRTPYRQQ